MTAIAIWQCFPIIGELCDQHGDFPLDKKTYFNMLRDLISGGPIGGRSTVTELQEGMEECLNYLQNIGWTESVCHEFSMMIDMIADHVYGEVPLRETDTDDEEAEADAEYEAETVAEYEAEAVAEYEAEAVAEAECDEDDQNENEALADVQDEDEAEVNTKGIEVGNASPIPSNVLNDPYMVWLAGYITAKVLECRHTSE